MSGLPHLVGMIHLRPLPGAPRFRGSLDTVIEAGVSEARTLADAGFPALLVENLGDVPFHADQVPAVTVAAMTAAVRAIAEATGLPLGVNVLRNDASAALGIAAATGAAFIRVNVLTGAMFTDQGIITGRAAQIARERAAIAPDTEVWADVMVKHATPPPGLDIRQAAADTVLRGLADAVIVTGPGTGAEPDLDQLRLVRSAVPRSTRLVIGSGAGPANLTALMTVADTVIVGSALKEEGEASGRVDLHRAREFAKAAADLGLL